MAKKSPQFGRRKTAATVATTQYSPDLVGKTGKKKGLRKNWTQTQSGGCGC